MKIDETSISIIKHLRNGRKSFKKIAEDLELSENTVRTRVSRLIDEGVLEITGLVNPEAIPRHRVVMVGVKLKTMDLVKKGEEFSKLPGVVSVSVITGRYDLMLVVFLREGYDVNAGVASIQGLGVLGWAASCNQPAIVKLLVEHGADVRARTRRGETPLAIARREGHAGIVAILEKHGAGE